MKGKLLISSLILGTALMALAATDPVLMTINGKDVKLSEFEYLYNKNNQQQIEKESLEDYVDRFVIYKLKVADAEAAGYDTLPAFKKEFEGYRDDFVKPFLEDTTVKNRLVDEAYDRMTKNVKIDHIMLPLGTTYEESQKQRALADSIRQCALNGEDWEELVEKYSVDPSKANNHGHYGFVTANMFPYAFEYAAFNTPVGQISEPVKTNYGYHLIRVNAIEPDAGMLHVRHILLLFPRNCTDSAKAAIKVRIDSIYEAVTAPGADFAEIAKKVSQDPGTRNRGGDLVNFFGRGQMVPQFEEVSYSLKDGEISKPFETRFGYHIVQRLESRPVRSFEAAKPDIEARIARDERSTMPQEKVLAHAKELYNFKYNDRLGDILLKAINDNGGYDTTFVKGFLANCSEPMFTFAGNQSRPVSEIAPLVNPMAVLNPIPARDYIMSHIDPIANKAVMDYYKENLINDNPDYRNLINEYRDGMLLYEVSNRRVWEGASRDTAGLNKYFEQNRAKYHWDAPRFKGIILSAKNDSVLNAVKDDVRVLGADTLTITLYKKYGRDIKMERMLMAKGENDLVDYLFFAADKPQNLEYPVFMVLEGGLINQPEGLADVKGMVTSDYQDVLEKRWVEELRAKYPVKINKKVLKKIQKK